MEPSTQQPQQSPPAQQYSTLPAPKKKSSLGIFLIILLLLVVAGVACYGVYAWQHAQLTKSQQSLSTANAEVQKLTQAQKTYQLPTHQDFSPQCASGNNSELVVASLTPQPVDNYQAYLVACAGDNTIPTRVMAFKVNSDGSRTFAYGAGTGEPLCISSKIIDATAAKDISKQTGLPICKTF